ncbi:MAG: NAD(P)H-dependent oxidoreductase [Planctomycetota bacterium]
MSTPKILAFGTSLREGSFNHRLAEAAATYARDAGAGVTVVRLRDFPMPIFDEDLESREGMPEHAQRFKDLLIEHDGFLISNAEYNSSMTAAFKNAIDWASRPKEGEPPLHAFAGKCASLLGCSPGGLGGLRVLSHTRDLLLNIRVNVLGNQYALSNAGEAFNDDGTLARDKDIKAVSKNARELAEVLIALKR